MTESRNYPCPAIPAEWANSRHTDQAIAVAIHAIADTTRSADDIWEAPTPAEWDHVAMAVHEYVRNGDFPYEPEGYCWGQEMMYVEEF